MRWTFDTVEPATCGATPRSTPAAARGTRRPIDLDARRRVLRRRQPGAVPGHAEFPNGSSRPGAEPLHRLGRRARRRRPAKLRWYHQVHPARHLRPRPGAHAHRPRRRTATDVVVSAGKGGVVVGLDPDTGERRWATPVGVHQNDDLDASSPARPRSCPARSAACSRRRRPPTASSTSRRQRARRRSRPTRPRTSAPSWARATARSSPSTPRPATSAGTTDGARRPARRRDGRQRPRAHRDCSRARSSRSTGRPARSCGRTTAPGGINGWMSAAGDLARRPRRQRRSATPRRVPAAARFLRDRPREAADRQSRGPCAAFSSLPRRGPAFVVRCMRRPSERRGTRAIFGRERVTWSNTPISETFPTNVRTIGLTSPRA